MKKTFAMTCLIAGTLLGPVVAIATDSDTDRSNPEAFAKDSAITTKIKTMLAVEHFTSLATIHVDTAKNGVVWLSGTAESQVAIDRAMAIAQGTENVKSVNSRLTVKKSD